jgi:hypothetical protein
MFNELFPTFVSVTACGADTVPSSTVPKFRFAGDKVTLSVGMIPVPESCIVCGLFEELSVIVSMPAREVPAAVGVKVTLMVQFAGAVETATRDKPRDP